MIAGLDPVTLAVLVDRQHFCHCRMVFLSLLPGLYGADGVRLQAEGAEGRRVTGRKPVQLPEAINYRLTSFFTKFWQAGQEKPESGIGFNNLRVHRGGERGHSVHPWRVVTAPHRPGRASLDCYIKKEPPGRPFFISSQGLVILSPTDSGRVACNIRP
jgi:hypothetical protein